MSQVGTEELSRSRRASQSTSWIGSLPAARHAYRFWPFATLAVLALLPYWSLIFSDSLILDYDVVAYFYPYRHYAAEALLAGSVPLWNPYLFAGVPFLANIQTAVFYPPNLLYVLFPTSLAINLSIILHVFVAGLSAYLYARCALELERFAGLVAAAAYMYSGFFAAHTGHLNQVATASWAPLVILALHLVVRERTLKSVVLAGVVLAIQLLAGHPQEFYYTALVVAAYVPYVAVVMYRFGWATLGALALAAAAVGVAGLLAAAQLLPTLELSAQSYRSGSLTPEQATVFPVAGHRLLDSILPGFVGSPYVEVVGYVGFLATLLALAALVFAFRSSYVRFFALTALVALTLSFGSGTPLYGVLFEYLPGFAAFRVPGRWLLVFVLSLSFLAGIGASVVIRRAREPRRWPDLPRFLAPVLASICVVAVLSSVPWRPNGERVWLPGAHQLSIWVAVGSASCLLICLVLGGRLRGIVSQSILTAFVIAELLVADQAMHHHQFGPSSLLSERDASVESLRATIGSERVLSLVSPDLALAEEDSLRQALSAAGMSASTVEQYVQFARSRANLFPNVLLVDRLRTADGYDGGLLPTGDYVRLRQALTPGNSVSPDLTLRHQLGSTVSARALSLLGVRYVLTSRSQPLIVDDVAFEMAELPALKRDSTRPIELRPSRSTRGTSLAILSYLGDSAAIRQGEVVAEVEVIGGSGRSATLPIRAGIDTAEWALGKPDVARAAAHQPVRVAGYLDKAKHGQLYFASLDLPGVTSVQAVRFRYVHAEGSLHLRGASIVDGSTRSVVSLGASRHDDNLREVRSGPVSVFEPAVRLPRAYVTHSARVVSDPEAVSALLADPDWDISRTTLVDRALTNDLLDTTSQGDLVTITRDEPERVEIDARLSSAGLLVLNDSYYPGWRVTVDGTDGTIVRANAIMRAVPLGAGAHEIRFTYEPASFRAGLAVSLGSIAVVAFLIGWRSLRSARSREARGESEPRASDSRTT